MLVGDLIMKIDAINFGAFTATTPIQITSAEETETSGDEFDDTRIAEKNVINNQHVSVPIERQNGTIEDLISMQASTEKMAHSYGYSNIEQATNSTSVPTDTVSAVSNNMSFKA